MESTGSFFNSGVLKDYCLPLENADVERHVLSDEGVKDFMNLQYEFLALEISDGTLLQNAHYEAAMPFKKNDRLAGARGAHGRIYEIEIDSRHQHLGKAFRQRVSVRYGIPFET